MKRWLVLATLALVSASCKQTRCEDLEPAPVIGSYKGGGSLGEERMLRVGLSASSKQVVLTWTTMEGAKIRATYRIASKTKQP